MTHEDFHAITDEIAASCVPLPASVRVEGTELAQAVVGHVISKLPAGVIPPAQAADIFEQSVEKAVAFDRAAKANAQLTAVH